jgi:hypothetical protein
MGRTPLVAIQEGQLLGMPEQYHLDFMKLLQNPDFALRMTPLDKW